MILLQIVAKNEELADEISKILIDHKLIIDAALSPIKVLQKKDDNCFKNSRVLITARTKALLFQKIDILIREHFGHNMPTVYSVPIVHMDWEQAEVLLKETEKV